MSKLMAPIKIKVINPLLNELGGLPQKATEGSSAFDVVACIDKAFTLAPGATEVVSSGFAIHINNPKIGAFLFPRSGMATKKGIILANTVGVIDSDYQGEVKVALFNRSPINQEGGEVEINPGDRIAQIVFMPVSPANLVLVEDFELVTARGEGGFGSTGTGHK